MIQHSSFRIKLGQRGSEIIIDGFRIRFHRLSALRSHCGFYGSWLAALFANMLIQYRFNSPGETFYPIRLE
ncbi:hypothetical protein OAM21_03615 [Verrucomicrobia bacterium]|nr:hypothetical protein [Verrucomicrobiota bacterium]